MVLMTIPSLMVFLSRALPARAKRWTNVAVGILYIVVVVGNVVGESWAFYLFGSVVEIVLLALVVGSSTSSRGHEHHLATSALVALEGRPRRFGGRQGGGGTRKESSSWTVHR
jgi:hypothetical protein